MYKGASACKQERSGSFLSATLAPEVQMWGNRSAIGNLSPFPVKTTRIAT